MTANLLRSRLPCAQARPAANTFPPAACTLLCNAADRSSAASCSGVLEVRRRLGLSMVHSVLVVVRTLLLNARTGNGPKRRYKGLLPPRFARHMSNLFRRAALRAAHVQFFSAPRFARHTFSFFRRRASRGHARGACQVFFGAALRAAHVKFFSPAVGVFTTN